MLRELDVRDLGIIEHVRLEVKPDFTVLTGETGAGKSLVVRSLQLLAGGRADSEDVRAGCDRLQVDGVFDRPKSAEVAAFLAGVGAAGGEELKVRREVTSSGRSRAWVDDVPVTIATLGRLAPDLLAIEGQHEQRGLTDASSHLSLVDAFGVDVALRNRVATAFQYWQETRRELAAQRLALAGRRDRLDVIAFQCQEIDGARLRPGEDAELGEERALLRHSGQIGELLARARGALGGDGESGSVALARAVRAVRELAALGIGVTETVDSLEQARVLTEDAERSLDALADRVQADPARLEDVESRLAVIERLARKFGGSLAFVLDHRRDLANEQEQLIAAEDGIARLEAEEGTRAAAFVAVAEELSARRREAAQGFAREVEGVLRRLAMPEGVVEVKLTRRLDPQGDLVIAGAGVQAAADGVDVAELLLSSNPGEPPRPLAKIASGGELSRVHLAIRTVLRDGHPREPLVLVFDEVDSGIGGRAADELAELLRALAVKDQVVVVTHLPQIAGRARTHLVVRKHASGGRTVTRVDGVEGDARIDEVVRMLGGGSGSRAVRAHARELLGVR